jgi:hypothetical protein
MQTHIKFTPLHPPFEVNKRMAFLKHLCLVFLAVTIVLNVHSQQVVVNGTCAWSDLDTDPETLDFGFADAVFEPEHVDFPVFVYRTKLNSWKSVLGYRFLTQEVTSVPEKFISPAMYSTFGGEYRIDARVSDGGGKPYLLVKVWPLRRSGRSVERLTSFRLEVDLEDAGTSRSRTLTFAESSVLSTGEWYKIAIARDGVYRIDRTFLSQLGVDVAGADPRKINIYGNGGSLLPDNNDVLREDDLVRNSIIVSGEEDGQFDNSDFILFYGKGPDTWNRANGLPGRFTWSHLKHYYSDSAYYFLRIGDETGQRIQTTPSLTDAASVVIDKFQDYQYLENDQYNLAQSGREFFGDKFDVTTTASYNFAAPNVLADTMLIEARVAVRSLGTGSTFSFSSFGQSAQVTPSAVFDSPTSSVARLGNISFTAFPNSSPIRIDVVFTKSNAEAQGWLDFIRINYMRS